MLGEAEDAEREVIEQLIETDDDVRRQVEEIRETSGMIEEALAGATSSRRSVD